jgi:hypothetical protein
MPSLCSKVLRVVLILSVLPVIHGATHSKRNAAQRPVQLLKLNDDVEHVPHRAFGPVRNDRGWWGVGVFAALGALLHHEGDPAARLKPRPFKASTLRGA